MKNPQIIFRLTVFIVVALLINVGHAQIITSAEYFFNTDPGVGNGVPVDFEPADSVDFIADIPVTGLPPGFHQVFIRFKDINSHWSFYEGRTFYISTAVSEEVSPPLETAEYFFDTDPGIGNGTAIDFAPVDSIDFIPDVPTTGLEPGFHNVFFRFRDTDNQWSLYEGRTFYISPTPLNNSTATLVAMEYFFDADPGVGNGTALSVTPGDTLDATVDLNTTGLEIGEHYAYIRVKDADGIWSLYQRDNFEIFDCPMPNASFTVNNVCMGDTTYFVDMSTVNDPATEYSWDIDNNGTTDYNDAGSVSHVFVTPGTYTAMLLLSYDEFCKDSIFQTFEVYELPEVSIEGLSESYCANSEDIVLIGSPSGGAFGGGQVNGDIFAPSAVVGSDSVYYSFTDTLGCTNQSVQFVTVYPVYTTEEELTICAGDSILLGEEFISSSGVYVYTLLSIDGCDSLITADVDVIEINTTVTLDSLVLTAEEVGLQYQWVDCIMDNMPIDGATGQSFASLDFGLGNGMYAVLITEGNCSALSSCHTVWISGIEDDVFAESIVVYPNPTSGQVSINLGANFKLINLKVHNALGQEIRAQEYRHADIIQLQLNEAPGIYFIEIVTDEGQRAVLRVMKME